VSGCTATYTSVSVIASTSNVSWDKDFVI